LHFLHTFNGCCRCTPIVVVESLSVTVPVDIVQSFKKQA
jgi:hypothetical protein